MGITVSPASPAPTQTPFVYDYGYFKSTERLSDLEILQIAYRDYQSFRDGAGSIGGLGLKRDTSQPYPKKSYIFRKIAEMFWGPTNKSKQFVWHPWAEKMNEAVHENPITKQSGHVAFNGCAASGKTDFLSVFGIVNWFCAPIHTLVLCTSTGLKESRQRIWGRIVEYYRAVPGLPGKLVDSQGLIVTTDVMGSKVSDRCGLALVAGEKKSESEAMGKIIGAHNKRVFLLADELPELSQNLILTAMSNLAANEFFQMVASGNFKSREDPFGNFCEPKDGYDSITINDTEWETKLGYCVRFDGMKSPNILEGRTGKDAYPGIFARKHLQEIRDARGENSAEFFRMCRSFEPPIGLDNAIYSESDFIAGRSYEGVIWLDEPTPISGLDLGFTNGGDRTCQWLGKWGQDKDGIWVLWFDHHKLLHEDARLKDKTRNFQIAEQFIANCKDYGVQPQHAGIDSTAAGGVFCDIVAELWSPKILRVDFSGAPSELHISINDRKTARQAYDRRVTELWYVGVEFVKSKQIRGLSRELTREMKARIYDTVKGAEGLRMVAEKKSDMRERIGFSPDIADGAFVTLDVCRQRLRALAGTATSGQVKARASWKEQVDRNNLIFVNANYSPEEFAQVI